METKAGKAGQGQTAQQQKGPAQQPGTAQSAPVAEKAGSGALATMDFAADAGMGMEGADKDSFAIPFIAMLQPMSPAVAESLVEGAKPGMMLNTVTNELASSLRVLPVTFKRVYLRWTPREKGGGFKGEMSVGAVEQLIKDGKAKDVPDDKGTPRLMFEGDLLKDTRIHYVLVLKADGSGCTPAVMSLASTQIKRSKRWMAQISNIQMKDAQGRAYNPASFSHVYVVKTEKETNEKGTWFSFDVNVEGPVSDAGLYNKAKEFHAQIVKGSVKVNHDQMAETAEPAEGDGTGKF